MSYEIDQWKTKKLTNLRIPLKSFYKHLRADWHPSIERKEDGTVTLVCGCGQEIIGTIGDDVLAVTKFNMAGEGSGTFYNWILEPALKDSTGELEAVLIWERGDYINRLHVKDGVITDKKIEL